MSRFFVGQRVRIIRSVGGNVGRTGRITHMGHWNVDDLLPSGRWLGESILGWCNTYLALDGGGGAPANTANLEPILPEGHKASEYSLSELLDRCREGVSA